MFEKIVGIVGIIASAIVIWNFWQNEVRPRDMSRLWFYVNKIGKLSAIAIAVLLVIYIPAEVYGMTRLDHNKIREIMVTEHQKVTKEHERNVLERIDLLKDAGTETK